MKLRTSYPRASISLFLAIAVASVFTLRSFAAPEANKAANKAAGETVAQDCTGTLTVKAGQVTINGNAAQTGATVITGSVISTSSNGKAIIDLGALGRVEVGDNTTATLTCAAGSLEIRTNCSKTEVEVRRGAVDVRAPKVETLTAGKKKKYDDAVDLTATGGVDVKVECEGRKVAGGLYVGPGLLGLLALVGVGAAVAGGIAAGSSGGSRAISPIR
jgi:hypothetical protein